MASRYVPAYLRNTPKSHMNLPPVGGRPATATTTSSSINNVASTIAEAPKPPEHPLPRGANRGTINNTPPHHNHPFFQPTYWWVNQSQSAVNELIAARHTTPITTELEPSILTATIERFFPGIDRPIQYHNFSPRASNTQIRARAYALTAYQLSKIVTIHFERGVSPSIFRYVEGIVEMASHIMGEASTAFHTEPHLEYACPTMEKSQQHFGQSLEAIGGYLQINYLDPLPTYREGERTNAARTMQHWYRSSIKHKGQPPSKSFSTHSTSPYFQSQLWWISHTKAAAATIRAKLFTSGGEYIPISLSTLVEIIESELPHFDHPVLFDRFQPVASVSQLRARAYALTTFFLSKWILQHNTGYYKSLVLSHLELVLEATNLLLKEAKLLQELDPSLEYSTSFVGNATCELGRAKKYVHSVKNCVTTPSLVTIRQLVKCAATSIQRLYRSTTPRHKLCSAPIIAQRTDSWWKTTSCDVAVSIVNSNHCQTKFDCTTSIMIEPTVLIRTVEKHFRGLDHRQHLIDRRALRARAYANTALWLARYTNVLLQRSDDQWQSLPLLEHASTLIDLAHNLEHDMSADPLCPSTFAVQHVESASDCIQEALTQCSNTLFAGESLSLPFFRFQGSHASKVIQRWFREILCLRRKMKLRARCQAASAHAKSIRRAHANDCQSQPPSSTRVKSRVEPYGASNQLSASNSESRDEPLPSAEDKFNVLSCDLHELKITVDTTSSHNTLRSSPRPSVPPHQPHKSTSPTSNDTEPSTSSITQPASLSTTPKPSSATLLHSIATLPQLTSLTSHQQSIAVTHPFRDRGLPLPNRKRKKRSRHRTRTRESSLGNSSMPSPKHRNQPAARPNNRPAPNHRRHRHHPNAVTKALRQGKPLASSQPSSKAPTSPTSIPSCVDVAPSKQSSSNRRRQRRRRRRNRRTRRRQHQSQSANSSAFRNLNQKTCMCPCCYHLRRCQLLMQDGRSSKAVRARFFDSPPTSQDLLLMKKLHIQPH